MKKLLKAVTNEKLKILRSNLPPNKKSEKLRALARFQDAVERDEAAIKENAEILAVSKILTSK